MKKFPNYTLDVLSLDEVNQKLITCWINKI